MESGTVVQHRPKQGFSGILPPVTVPDRPCDIEGISPKFDKWRPHQKEAVQWILKNLRAPGTVILNSPVGSGKSLTGIAVARLLKMKATYLCPTLQLQQQVVNDFPDAVTVWGRSNFACMRFPSEELTAADCTHELGSPCPQVHSCEYLVQKRQALQANIAVLNTSYALHEMNYVGQFSGSEKSPRRALLIVDEADVLPGEMLNFVSLSITARQLERCKIDPPKLKTKVASWLEWAGPALAKVQSEFMKLENKKNDFVDSEKAPPRQLMREHLVYRRLLTKLSSFTENVDEHWVAELDRADQWEFKPIWVSRFGHMITSHGPRILAMSGTIGASAWAGEMGINIDTISYYSVPSTFPIENRPVIYYPVADFGLKNTSEDDMQNMVRVVDDLMEKHKDQKGLIHAVSYKVSQYIMNHSRHHDWLMTHGGAGDRMQVLDTFTASEAPKVLVSPSFTRGVDLAGDLARYQIIVKLPFLSLDDKQTARRRWSGKSGERWYLRETVYNIVQMYGRIIRSATDWGKLYILDSRWEQFFEDNKKEFPQWFVEAVEIE